MNQPKAHILKQRAELVYPYLELPECVREFRPFYEGVLSFHHTKGDRRKVYHGYRKDGFHAQDWNLGWQTAKQYEQRKQTFKFLARVEIEGSQIEAPDLTACVRRADWRYGFVSLPHRFNPTTNFKGL